MPEKHPLVFPPGLSPSFIPLHILLQLLKLAAQPTKSRSRSCHHPPNLDHQPTTTHSCLKYLLRPYSTQMVNKLLHLASPPELVARILELAVEDSASYNSRLVFLCCASLVCKAWSVEARVLLWRKVVILEESEALKLLSSPALGSYTTNELVLMPTYDPTKFTAASCTAVASALVGIKRLTMDYFMKDVQLDGTIFSLPSLRGAQGVDRKMCLCFTNFDSDSTRLTSLDIREVYFSLTCPPFRPLSLYSVSG